MWISIWDATSNETIEHIYPQTGMQPGEGKLPEKEYHANRLGNLVILPRRMNSKIQNIGFEDKKHEYNKTEMLATKEILEYKDWDIRTIDQRTTLLLEWAAKRWDNISVE
ncbi:HNH endonuclease [Anaerobacillus sp. HL2]|nr:HNH endonuclease [Anaerobacillus sp. HL2]